MPHFDYNDPLNLLTPDTVKKIATLREYKGKQVLYLGARPDVLEKLCTSAKIRSADARDASSLYQGQWKSCAQAMLWVQKARS